MVIIDKLTPEQLERFIHLQGIVARQANDADRVRALRLYYDGEHPVLFDDQTTGVPGRWLTAKNLPSPITWSSPSLTPCGNG